MKALKVLLAIALSAVFLSPAYCQVPGAEESVSFLGNSVYGTLLYPPGGARVPVVLIIAGSGPTDRNGNINAGLVTNAYHMLADSLAVHHIASLRYDKRGVGKSAQPGKSESELTFDTYTSDATSLIRKLKTDPRFSKVIVLGHSEGSLIGMLSSEKEEPAAYISVAGPGDRIDKIIETQIAAAMPGMASTVKAVFDSLVNGENVHPPATLNFIFRPSVIPYLKSWLKYDPRVEIAKLKVPVMIVQGNTDLQVSVNEAVSLSKAQPKAKLLIVDQMNHIWKKAPLDRPQNMATYSNGTLPLVPAFVSGIVGFISGLPR